MEKCLTWFGHSSKWKKVKSVWNKTLRNKENQWDYGPNFTSMTEMKESSMKPTIYDGMMSLSTFEKLRTRKRTLDHSNTINQSQRTSEPSSCIISPRNIWTASLRIKSPKVSTNQPNWSKLFNNGLKTSWFRASYISISGALSPKIWSKF